MRKKLLIIIPLIISVPFLIFILDDFVRREFENPFRVGKMFCFSYVTQYSRNMKIWADKEVYNKIDNLQYSTRLSLPGSAEEFAYKKFDLVCSRKLGNTVVCTYVLDFFKESPFCYSVVLQPVGALSLWERVKKIISFEVPLGNKIVGFPHSKKRWLVVDFYTGDAYDKYVAKVRKMKDGWDVLSATYWPTLEEMDEKQIYEESWGQAEKTRQNKEMEKLYRIYRDLPHNNAKGNLSEKDG